MDRLTFIGEIVQAVAWPATVLIGVFLLRRLLSDLIPTLQKLKYKDLELEFGRQVQEVRQELQAELPVPFTPGYAQPTDAVIAKLADVSPRAAILEAWRQVEDALARAAQRRQVEFHGRQGESPLGLIRALQQREILDSGKIGILHELRVLRNSAAHAPDFALSRDSVLEYARAAGAIVEYLDHL